LKSTLGIGLGLRLASFAANAENTDDQAKKLRPQVGDWLVFARGDHQGQLVTLQEMPVGGPPVIVYAMDPQTQAVRDGSRLNQVLLVRLAQESLAEPTRGVAAEGIVGYSAICTHTGCDVSGWQDESKYFICPCHASTFDPKDRARVVSGPAPRPLAVLPLRLADGKVSVAGAFSGRVGAEQK
jgi:Rieske Fe-S protein